MSVNNQQYMQRCLVLAEQGRFTVKSGALVGCVIVKANQVIAEGWHQYPGQAHAEVAALEQAGEQARGGTMYVSLEPCSHWGKTGPCCDAVIASGISKVVYGMIDPNPLVSGNGLKRLEVAGIEVEGPVLAKECADLNAGFIKRISHGLPYVRCKLAMSLDGKTAMANGQSKWITGPQAREDVQQLRAKSAAILTGIGTVLADNPSLNVRVKDLEFVPPIRVIVDSQLLTPRQAKILQPDVEVILVNALTESAEAERYTAANVTVKSLSTNQGRVDLLALMKFLAQEKSCNDVLIESGPILAGAMMQAGLIDEIITYIAPSLLGSDARPLLNLPGMENIADKIDLELMDVVRIGNDCRIRTRVTKTGTL